MPVVDATGTPKLPPLGDLNKNPNQVQPNIMPGGTPGTTAAVVEQSNIVVSQPAALSTQQLPAVETAVANSQPKPKYHYKHSGCLSCRNIGCSFLLLVLAAILAIILIFAIKPAPLWNPLVQFINNDIAFTGEAIRPEDRTAAIDKVTEQLKAGKVITVSEKEANAIISGQLSLPVFVILKNNTADVLVNIANTPERDPLWTKIVLEDTDKSVKITNITTGRVALPSDIVNKLNDQLQRFLVGKSDLTFSELVLKAAANLNVEEIKLEEKQITIEMAQPISVTDFVNLFTK